MDNAKAQARMRTVATTGAMTVGSLFSGLNATPTGSTNTAVANFDGATVTRRIATTMDPATLAADYPVDAVDSTTLGTTFTIRARGRWAIVAGVVCQDAGTIFAGLGVDELGGLSADPNVPDGLTILDTGRYVGAAGDDDTIKLAGFVEVRQGETKVVRLKLSDGAGAAPAAANLVLASCYVNFARIGDVD